MEEILKTIKEGFEHPTKEFWDRKYELYFSLFQAIFEKKHICSFQEINTGFSKCDAYTCLYSDFLDFVKLLKENSIELTAPEMTDFVVRLVKELPRKLKS